MQLLCVATRMPCFRKGGMNRSKQDPCCGMCVKVWLCVGMWLLGSCGCCLSFRGCYCGATGGAVAAGGAQTTTNSG